MAQQTNPILRFNSNPTRKNAIHAMCAQCMGCTEDWMEPGFREEVRNCSDYSCPLHSFRPFKRSNEQTTEAK